MLSFILTTFGKKEPPSGNRKVINNVERIRKTVMYIGYGYYIVAMTETKQLVDDPNVIKSCMTDPSLAGVTYISMTKNMQLNIPPRPPIARKRQI